MGAAGFAFPFHQPMVCPHCGAENPASAGRCTSCGEAFSESALPTIAAAGMPSLSSSAPTMAATAGSGRVSGLRQGPLDIGAPFGTRYRILRALGAGGMGVVYQAWDDELGVAVALKVIRPEVVADPQAGIDVEKRFKRELLLARQVTHKNVVRIHDLGEVEGIKYLTMPYIDGRDLGSIIREARSLPIPRALRIAKQVASGLQAAHEAGVIHRDLKPENVMIDGDDHASIMDFGISRSIGPDAAASMTAHGAIVGTLEYMAPEQGRGADIDHRADIYAFGLMMRDMLVGRKRLTASNSAIAEMMNRMTRPLPSMKADLPDVPNALDAIVSRCVELEPDKRFSTTADLVAALDALDADGNLLPAAVVPQRRSWLTLTAGALLFVVAGVALALWWRGRVPAPPPPVRAPMSVLIADFQNATNDPVFQGSLEQALGIALEGASFISAFSRQDAQRIVTRNWPDRGGQIDEANARLVATREGIQVILAGRIATAGQGYTLDVRALDAQSNTDRVLATEQVRASSKAAVLEAVGSLAAKLRRGLGETELTDDATGETFTAGSIDAMRAYVRGQELNKAGRPQEALDALKEAVRLDPRFGRAYVNMGAIYTNLKQDDVARQHYEQALKLLDRMTTRERYRTQGIYYLGINRDYEKAIDNFKRLVNEFPADNIGHSNLALAYLYVRDVPHAMEVGKRAVELNPTSLLQRTNYATYAMYGGEFDTAVAEATTVLGSNKNYEFAHLTLALSKLAQGKVDDARAAYSALAAVSSLGKSMAAMGEADLEMLFGRHTRALELLAPAIAADEASKSETNLALKLVAQAEAFLATGDVKRAVAAVERARTFSDHESVLYPSGRVLIAAGTPEKALLIAQAMQDALPSQTRSYAQLLNGAVALHRKRYAEAIDAVRGALKLHDSWAGHVLLAEAYTAAGGQNAAQAQDEWNVCINRRGEATDAFFADSSTLRYLPAAYYWLGHAQQSLGGPGAARGSFEKYLEFRAQPMPPDPLAIDARTRIGAR
jgi:eukaryotic-like serine/threonine-protein kinase